jgi:hypothetical protein
MIVALAGRRIDEDGASYQRFPLQAVPRVQTKIRKFFTDHGVTHVVSSGACGTDLLAQEIASELGIERTVILPCDAAAFRKTSVIDRPGEWGVKYDRLLKELDASHLIDLGYSPGDNVAYEKTNLKILSTSEGLSRFPDKHDVVILIVWEGKPKNDADLTYDLKKQALKNGLRTEEINTLV